MHKNSFVNMKVSYCFDTFTQITSGFNFKQIKNQEIRLSKLFKMVSKAHFGLLVTMWDTNKIASIFQTVLKIRQNCFSFV